MRLAPTLLLLAAFAAVPAYAAETAPDTLWGAATAAGKPPVGWTWTKAESPNANVLFNTDELVLVTDPARWGWVQRPLSALDGSDDQPLVVSCGVAATGAGALWSMPAVLVLRWGDQDLVGVGISDNAGHKGVATWTGWCVGGKRAEQSGALDSNPPGSLTQVRLLVQSHVVLVQASRDGSDWRTLSNVPRQGALQGPPTAIALGHGWLLPGATDGKLQGNPSEAKPKTEKDGSPILGRYRFASLRAVRVGADLSPSLTRTYQRKESGDDTREAIYADTFPSTWRIAGPFAQDKDPIPSKGIAAPGVEWKAITPTGRTSDRILQLDDLLPGNDAATVRYATFTIEADQPRCERFLFDGLRDALLTVNGRQIITARSQDDRRLEIDRIGAIAWLSAGTNTVVVRIASLPRKGEARLVLRHEPGDARYRAALTKRLITDFPPDPVQLASDRIEIARAWESAGNLQAAVAAYGEAAAGEDAPTESVIVALTAQARIHSQLHDDPAQAADVAALGKAWAVNGADRVTAVLRSARLNTLLGRNDLAAQVIDQALADKLSADDRVAITCERLRLSRALGQEDRVVAGLNALAAALPAGDARLVPTLITAARFAVPPATADAPAKSPDLTAVKAAAIASKRPIDLHLALLAAQAANIPVAGKPPGGDEALIHALGKALAEACVDSDPLVITGAEAAGDEAFAAVTLRRHLAALGAPAPEKASLAELRQRVLRARIGLSAEGRKLLSEVDALAPAVVTPELTTWSAIGPFSNDGWRAYDKPPVDPAAAASSAAIDGHQWKQVTTDATGYIDFGAAGLAADNSVVVMTCDVTAAVAGEVMLSCGADDGLTVWCNGSKVYEDRIQRGCDANSLRVPLPLRAGANRLTVMVQNGNGGFAFQGRLRVGPWPARELAQVLANVGKPEQREAAATALATLVGQLINDNRPEAGSFAQVAQDVFPDQVARAIDVATAVYGACDGRPIAPYGALPDCAELLSRVRVAGWQSDRLDFWRTLNFFLGERLRKIGAFTTTQRMLELSLLTDPDPSAQARIQFQLAALYRFAGDGQVAVPLLAQVADDPALGPDEARWAREQGALLRRAKGEIVRLEAPMEVGNTVRSVERLVAAGDLEGLIPAAQKLIESAADIALPSTRGQGTSGWHIAVNALNGLGVAAGDAYRAKYQSRAEAALRNAAHSSDAAACERVALRYPLCTTRGPALLRAAELYRDEGDLALARTTAAVALPALTDPALQAKAKAFTTLKLVPPSAVAGPAAVLNAIYPTTSADAADLARFANRHTACVPAAADGVFVLHDGGGVLGLDLATGALRWRQPAAPSVGATFSGLPVWETTVDGSVVAARLRSAKHRLAVVRIDPSTGGITWTTEDNAELTDLVAVASPEAAAGRIYAAFADAEGVRRLVALKAGDGQILWQSQVPGHQPLLPATNDALFDLAGHGAPPTAVGRELYWCSDTGSVLRLDAGNGVLAWAAAYPRAIIDSGEARATMNVLARRDASRVVVADETVIVAPRDTLRVLAYERATGVLRWSRKLSDIRCLAGITGGAKPLVIAQGTDVEAIDPATGATVWSLPDTQSTGRALVEAGAVFVSTDGGVLRLDPLTGKILAKVPWPADGQSGGTLVRVGKQVVAMSQGRLATVGGAAKPLVIAPPTGAPLVASGLAAQPGGPALGLAFRWAGGPVSGIFPAPTGNENYVRSDAWLARIDGAGQPVLAWQVPIDAGVTAIGLTRSCVVTVQKSLITFYDRATGTRRATVPNPFVNNDTDGSVAIGDDGVACWVSGWSVVEVLDPDDGSRILRHEIGTSVHVATIRDGKLIMIRGGEGGAWLDERDLRTGTGSVAKRLPFGRMWEIRVLRAGRDRWVLGVQDKVVTVDLRNREVTPLENRGTWGGQQQTGAEVPGGAFAISLRDWNRHEMSVVYAADGKVAVAQDHFNVSPAFFADRMVVQQLEKQDFSLAAYAYGSGKELWRWNGVGKEWERAAKALLPLGDRTVLIDQRRDNLMRWNLIGANGKPQADGILPGQHGPDFVARVIGDQVWVGTATGLAIMVPCATDAVAKLTMGDEVPVAERTLRDLNVRGTGPSVDAENVTVAIDGDLADWPEEPARIALPGDHRPATISGSAHIGRVRFRSTYDKNQLAFAVEVEERSGAPVTLRLGLDTIPDGSDRRPTPVLEISSRDGVSAVQMIGGGWSKSADAGDLEPTARVVHGLDGWRFEIAVPWPLLRERVEWRPGDFRNIRYGLLAETAGDAVEFGHGLTLWRDTSLFALLHLGRTKK